MALVIPGALFDTAPVTVTGYRSPESGQTENSGTLSHTGAKAYETLYTVTVGKTFNITNIVISLDDGLGNNTVCNFAIGGAAAEVDFITMIAVHDESKQYTFEVPIKVTSGSRISVKCNTNGDDEAVFTIVGFEE